jgi:acylphosphatase
LQGRIVLQIQAVGLIFAVRPFAAGADLICKRFLVGGRVQGVFYRATVAQHARKLAITGHAHNLPDGRVEVLAYGELRALEELEHQLWIGSSASKVTAVDAMDTGLDPSEAPPDTFRTG